MTITKIRVLLFAALICLIAGYTVSPARAQKTSGAGYMAVTF
jgi:hypothetical protein